MFDDLTEYVRENISESDAWAVIMVLFIAVVVFFVFAIIYTIIKKKSNIYHQDELIKIKFNELKHGLWFKVKYCSEDRFKIPFKFVPWENSGILLLEHPEITYYYFSENNQILKMVLNINNTNVKWIGGEKGRNGPWSWLMIENKGNKYYFSAETGMTNIGSKASTKRIYDNLCELKLSESEIKRVILRK